MYRSCLRWDTGFTCCYCLLHESDLSEYGAEGSGLTWIEHIEPQNSAPALANVYSNCAYSCRFCNRARGTQPVRHPSGARLLDPWQDAWGEYFRLHDGRLEPLREGPGGRDARYTELTYRLNDHRKIAMRKRRREVIVDRLKLFSPYKVAELRSLAMRQQTPEDRKRMATLARDLVVKQGLARQELQRYRAIPSDAPSSCRCGTEEHHSLPPEVAVIQPHWT